MTSTPLPPRRRGVDLALVVCFVASLSAVAFVPRAMRDRVVQPSTFVAAFEAAERASETPVERPDLVLVHPPWRDDVVDALKKSALIGGRTVTTAFSPVAGQATPALTLVADDGAPLSALLRRALDRIESMKFERDGVVVVDLPGEGGPASGARDLLADLSTVVMEVAGPGDLVTRCPLDADGSLRCEGRAEWLTSSLREVVVGGRRERCLWSHPLNAATVRFSVEARAEDGKITLSAALADAAAGNPDGAAVTWRILDEGVERARVVRRAGDTGFASGVIAPIGASRARRLTVEVTAPHDGQRHACFRMIAGRRGAR